MKYISNYVLSFINRENIHKQTNLFGEYDNDKNIMRDSIQSDKKHIHNQH